jgi:hypothetical protein
LSSSCRQLRMRSTPKFHYQRVLPDNGRGFRLEEPRRRGTGEHNFSQSQLNPHSLVECINIGLMGSRSGHLFRKIFVGEGSQGGGLGGSYGGRPERRRQRLRRPSLQLHRKATGQIDHWKAPKRQIQHLLSEPQVLPPGPWLRPGESQQRWPSGGQSLRAAADGERRRRRPAAAAGRRRRKSRRRLNLRRLLTPLRQALTSSRLHLRRRPEQRPWRRQGRRSMRLQH